MSLIVIALICTFFLLTILVVHIIDKGVPDENGIVFYSFILSFGILLFLLFSLNEPKAIDVYRGKTTLEITYKDKVPIDSTVVWKKQ